MSVYFASIGPYIKIGYSENPERRVRRLFASATRYGAPRDAPTGRASRHLIRYIDGDTGTEAAVHAALSDFAVGCEWFVDEPEVRDFIASVETASRYEPVMRPGGPARLPYDEARDLPPEDYAALQIALNSMFARPATK